MKNIYHDYLNDLRSCLKETTPALSLYVPLVEMDEHPQKIFSNLMKVSKKLLVKNGHKVIEIIPPDWEKLRSRGALSIALFAQENYLQIIPLPTKLQPRVVVANSFHVKPILAAANEYTESMMLHFHSAGATLYEVSSVTETILETYLPPTTSLDEDWIVKLSRLELRSYLGFLSSEIGKQVKGVTKYLAISGAMHRELLPLGIWGGLNLPLIYTDDSFQQRRPEKGVQLLRHKMSETIAENHRKVIAEFTKDSSGTHFRGDYYELATKILNKEITSLCISLEDMAFGKLDLVNGGIIISQAQMDSKDDDLLDDLLELALDQRISVRVVPKKFFPEGKTFVAY